jgi:hypothetical protein
MHRRGALQVRISLKAVLKDLQEWGGRKREGRRMRGEGGRGGDSRTENTHRLKERPNVGQFVHRSNSQDNIRPLRYEQGASRGPQGQEGGAREQNR